MLDPGAALSVTDGLALAIAGALSLILVTLTVVVPVVVTAPSVAWMVNA